MKDNRGNTPLMIAVLSGNLDAVKVVNIMFAAVQFCHTSHDAHTMYTPRDSMVALVFNL